MKQIGIITPGGDASGMNACIRAIVRSAVSSKLEVIGIIEGFAGLLKEKFIQLNLRSVSGIINHGGTILKSSRCREIRTAEGLKKAAKILKKQGIESLIILGGDGSLSAGAKIARMDSGISAGLSNLSVMGIPASIDNDVYGTDETIGFDTAIDTAVHAIDNIRDTAVSFNRVFIIEVMGRERGFLAGEVGLASGAEFILVPEIKYNVNKICRKLKEQQQQKKTSVIIVFAEGCGNLYKLANQISKKTQLEVRVSSLGYIQRGGSPSARSRNLASRFGDYAVELILNNRKNLVVVLKEGDIKSVPIDSIIGKEQKIDTGILKLANRLAV